MTRAAGLSAAICGCIALSPLGLCSQESTQPSRKARQTVAVDRGSGIKLIYDRNQDGELRWVLEGASKRVMSLETTKRIYGTHGIEGRWIILAASQFSIEDVGAIMPAVKHFQQREGDVRLGVIAFGEFEEARHLIPHITGSIGNMTPLWCIVQDGEALEFAQGPLDEEELQSFLDRAFKGTPEEESRRRARKVRQAGE